MWYKKLENLNEIKEMRSEINKEERASDTYDIASTTEY